MKRTMAVLAVIGMVLIAAGAAEARGRGGHGGVVHHGWNQGHRLPGHHHSGHRHHFHRHHHHGFHGSFLFGFGTGALLGSYWGPWGYPYAYAYPYPVPTPVVTEPQTYIEQGAPSYWYWCEASKAYYPYVRECPGGWTPVVPQPTPESTQ